MASWKRQQQHARELGFASDYEYRKWKSQGSYKNPAVQRGFEAYLRVTGKGASSASVSDYNRFRKEHNAARTIDSRGEKMPYEEFLERRGIVGGTLSMKGIDEGATMPTRSYDPSGDYGDDYDDYYDFDWDEWWEYYPDE